MSPACVVLVLILEICHDEREEGGKVRKVQSTIDGLSPYTTLLHEKEYLRVRIPCTILPFMNPTTIERV